MAYYITTAYQGTQKTTIKEGISMKPLNLDKSKFSHNLDDPRGREEVVANNCLDKN